MAFLVTVGEACELLLLVTDGEMFFVAACGGGSGTCIVQL